jgi:hypothetical protein
MIRAPSCSQVFENQIKIKKRTTSIIPKTTWTIIDYQQISEFFKQVAKLDTRKISSL